MFQRPRQLHGAIVYEILIKVKSARPVLSERLKLLCSFTASAFCHVNGVSVDGPMTALITSSLHSAVNRLICTGLHCPPPASPTNQENKKLSDVRHQGQRWAADLGVHIPQRQPVTVVIVQNNDCVRVGSCSHPDYPQTFGHRRQKFPALPLLRTPYFNAQT